MQSLRCDDRSRTKSQEGSISAENAAADVVGMPSVDDPPTKYGRNPEQKDDQNDTRDFHTFSDKALGFEQGRNGSAWLVLVLTFRRVKPNISIVTPCISRRDRNQSQVLISANCICRASNNSESNLLDSLGNNRAFWRTGECYRVATDAQKPRITAGNIFRGVILRVI